MVFTKDDLAVTFKCFTEKVWIATLNPLDYSIWDILQELIYEGRKARTVCKPQRSLKCYQKQLA